MQAAISHQFPSMAARSAFPTVGQTVRASLSLSHSFRSIVPPDCASHIIGGSRNLLPAPQRMPNRALPSLHNDLVTTFEGSTNRKYGFLYSQSYKTDFHQLQGSFKWTRSADLPTGDWFEWCSADVENLTTLPVHWPSATK